MLFINLFCLMNLQKITKRKSNISLIRCFISYFWYELFWHSYSNNLFFMHHFGISWDFIICLHAFKGIKIYIKTKMRNFKWFWNMVTNFRRWILWRVTVVLEKESWGIRISLNTTISVQVFNEILLISSCLSSKKHNTNNFFKKIFC